MLNPLIEYIKNKRILILGFGREGRSSYNYIRKYLPDSILTVADRRDVYVCDQNVRLVTGDDYLSCMGDSDIVFKSPGISFFGVSIPKGVEITCQTDLFMRFAPCMKIGVTGTKGKTTTSTLIYEILRAAGVATCLIGNIGVPVLDKFDSVEGSVAVIEMSSHQLEFTTVSPHVAVFTNLFEEHLDHYDGIKGYASAKLNIMRNQKADDFFIFNADQDLSGFYSQDEVKSKKLPVSASDGEKSEFLHSLTTQNPRLTGVHNHQDIFFAAAAARCLGISDNAVTAGIRGFGGIEHRMEPVGTYKDIKFINDCIATIPRAVMCAVEAVGDVDTLILGGMDRGLDFGDFCRALEESSVRNIIGLPETGHMICSRLAESGSGKKLYRVAGMEDAVEKAFRVTEKGKSCLLSPAAASYNYYRDFEEKGGHFKKLVRTLGESDG